MWRNKMGKGVKMSANLHELTASLKQAHDGFIEVAHQLALEQRERAGVCGEWSPKEVVAHLLGWDESLKQFIVDIENFVPPYNVDAFNQSSVETRANLSWTEVIVALETNFAALDQALATVEPDVKIYERVSSWLAGRIADYELHRGQFEVWLL